MNSSNSGHCYFWFRRDLRLHDNHGLFQALTSGKKVIPVFIFDTEILNKLDDKNDARVNFIFDQIIQIKSQLNKHQSDVECVFESPKKAWQILFEKHGAADIYTNQDEEPYAIQRDKLIHAFCQQHGFELKTYKDQVVFERNEVVKDDGLPYTVFTPYSKKWKALLLQNPIQSFPSEQNLSQTLTFKSDTHLSLESLGFKRNKSIQIPPSAINTKVIAQYEANRDFPAKDGCSKLSVHLRFGTVSIRDLVIAATNHSEKWLNELIWRDFYKQILWHFPHVVNGAFKPKYDLIPWRNNEKEFENWCNGNTGYPIVDAGMRELKTTGLMHNRIRMVVASFLTKHLLIDWRWGEAYFASKLLDFDLSSNNGGWQWAAGSGVDAAPYFRIFNPHLQTLKFDPQLQYIQKWVPEFKSLQYPQPIVNHELARKRCLDAYKSVLSA